MKHASFFTVVLGSLLLVHSARADWVIIQETQSHGKPKTTTMKVKGAKMRMDMGDDSSSFITEDGTVKMFMHKMKKVMVMDKAMMDAAQQLGANLMGNKASVVATGTKEKVGEWDTEIYTWKGPLGEAKFWVAKDFPNYQSLVAAMDKLSNTGANPMGKLMPKLSEFPGMVVKSEMTTMGKASGSKLVSAKEQAVEDKDFVEPEGYEAMKLPTFGGGLPGKAPK